MEYKVAVVIPTLNEELYIERCLETVRKQTFPFEEMDVMVVDGGSKDNTRVIVERYSEKWSNVRLIDNPERIQSIAFNIGVKNSSAPYVIRLDAHAEYHPSYIELCLKALSENHEIGDVGGVWDIRPRRKGIIPEANAILNQSRFGIGGASFRVGAKAGYVDTVPFGAFPRHVINEIGGMREDMPRAEDNEYVSRIKKAGYKIYLNPDIICTYYSRETIEASAKQMYANGLSIGHLFYVDRNAIGLRHFIPFLFVMSLLLSIIASLIWKPFINIFFLIIALYFLSSLVATTYLCSKHGWKYCFVLPLLFFIVHVSYGYGTIVGLLRYRNQKRELI